MEGPTDLEPIEDLVRRAIESGDLHQYAQLLDPQVRWGPPGDPKSGCHNRDQVLQWWRSSREAGTASTVTEVVANDDKLLVGLVVTRTEPGLDQGGETRRWQVLTLRGGRVKDIRGFETREAAAAAAGIVS